jgi:sugar phosphate isomerase/epimerase
MTYLTRTATTLLSAAILSGCASRAEQSNPFFVMDTWYMGTGATEIPSAEDQLELVRELGYEGYGCSLRDPDELRAIARSAEQKNLKLYSVYTGAALAPEGLTFDPRLEPAMEALESHGTIIWLTITSKDYATSSPEGDAAAVKCLRTLADAAKAHGLRIALYPHFGDWMERIQDAVRVARKADRPNLGVTFNLCHCLKVGDEHKIPQLLDEARPYLFLVTINGADANAADAGWDRLIQPLDQGTYNLRPLLNKLSELRYEGPIGLQGYAIKGNVRENLSRSMNAWRGLTGSDRRNGL